MLLMQSARYYVPDRVIVKLPSWWYVIVISLPNTKVSIKAGTITFFDAAGNFISSGTFILLSGTQDLSQ